MFAWMICLLLGQNDTGCFFCQIQLQVKDINRNIIRIQIGSELRNYTPPPHWTVADCDVGWRLALTVMVFLFSGEILSHFYVKMFCWLKITRLGYFKDNLRTI